MRKIMNSLPCTCCGLACAALLTMASSLSAQLPTAQFEQVFPAGGATDSTFDVTLVGKNLDETGALRFSHPGISARQKLTDPSPFDSQPQPIENTFTVSIAANVPIGRYEVRTYGKYGLSNPRAFLVGSTQETLETEPNGESGLPEWIETDQADGPPVRTNPANELTLPAVVNGRADAAADVDWFRFEGTAGTRVLLNAFTKRIDSKIDLAIVLYDATGQILSESRAGATGDPLIEAQLPADGTYFIKLHDSLFRNGTGFTYRLSIGSQPHLDFVFPPAGQAGTQGTYTLFGCNLPGGVTTDLRIDGHALQKLETRIAIPADLQDKLEFSSLIGPHQAGMDGFEYRVVDRQNPAKQPHPEFHRSNPLLITAATAPVVFEESDNDRPEAAQNLSLPCEVAGQFYPQRDADWFSFEAKEGEKWMLDVISQRLGANTDASLLVQKLTQTDEGKTKATDLQFIDDVAPENANNRVGRHEFDYRTTDPSYLLTAPEDGLYRVLIRDANSSVKSDPRLLYRFAIRKPKPDYRIVAVPGNSAGSLLLRRGGRSVIRLFVFRHDGFDGEVQVACEGLPKGVTTEPISIGPGNNIGTLILTTAADAPPTTSSISFTGTATVDGQALTRKARYGNAVEASRFAQPNSNSPSVMSRLVQDIQVCVTDYDPAPIRLTIGEGQAIETARGAKVKIPYQVHREEGTTGNLNAFVLDSPLQTSAPQVNIGTKQEGEFELTLRAATPPGTYTLYLAGYSQGYKYTRNPELAEAAKVRQERVAKIYADAQKTVQMAQAAVNNKTSESQSAANKVNEAKSRFQQAEQNTRTAQTAHTAAVAALNQKQQAFASSQEDAALQQQLTQAEAAAGKAQQALTDAKNLQSKAMLELTAAEAKQKTAKDEKLTADEALKTASAFQQQAQQEKVKADQFASTKKSESNPRNINFHVPSNSIRIKIAEFPIEIESLATELTAKQGEKLEVPLKVTRLYGFAASVRIQGKVPSGVSGISPQTITLAADKQDAMFGINVQENATVGTHDCTVSLQMSFNGQSLTMERPLRLTVTELEKEN